MLHTQGRPDMSLSTLQQRLLYHLHQQHQIVKLPHSLYPAMSLHLQGRPDLSLSILLQLRAADVFEFIEAHSLVGGWMGLGMGLRVLLFGWQMVGCECVLLSEAAAVSVCAYVCVGRHSSGHGS